jgi:hypothetical protein
MTRSLRDKAQSKLELYNGKSLLTYAGGQTNKQNPSLSSVSSQIWLAVYHDIELCRTSLLLISHYCADPQVLPTPHALAWT